MTLDPSGNIYIAGTTTSGALAATSSAAFPTPTGTSTNAFIGKFDQNLNPIFVTYAGTGGLSVTGLAATPDAVFLTGSIFGSTLPVTPSAIIQSPAVGSLQNGFVECFNSTGTALVYATYFSGQNGNTSPATITADTSDNAYIAGYTTSSGFPTLNALVPEILSPTSGFLTKLTPAADGILFSTVIPGPASAPSQSIPPRRPSSSPAPSPLASSPSSPSPHRSSTPPIKPSSASRSTAALSSTPPCSRPARNPPRRAWGEHCCSRSVMRRC